MIAVIPGHVWGSLRFGWPPVPATARSSARYGIALRAARTSAPAGAPAAYPEDGRRFLAGLGSMWEQGTPAMHLPQTSVVPRSGHWPSFCRHWA